MKIKRSGKKLDRKFLYTIISYTPLLSMSIVMYITFIYAYFNGHQATITINTYGEANIEFVLIPAAIIISIVCLIKFRKMET